MDHALFDLLAERAPKMNPAITKGYSTFMLSQAEDYLDKMIRALEPDFPPDFRYHGIVRCTPEEEYRDILKQLSRQNAKIEFAPTTTYMVKLVFSFQGEIIEPPTYVHLPYVTDGGLMRIHGSLYHISPVMADRVISVGADSIYIPIGRAKLTFKRLLHPMLVDGVRETTYVYWSRIHNLSAKMREDAKKRKVQGETTLGHYLFARYGVKGVFRQYCNTDVWIGNRNDPYLETLDQDQWVVCSSVTHEGLFRPRGVKDRYNYRGSQLAVAIPRKDYNLTTASLLCNLFYVADHFPTRVLAEYLNETDLASELRLWRVLIGLLLTGSPDGEGKVLENMETHFSSLEGCLDYEARKDLSNVGVYCQNVFDLLYWIIDNFSAEVASSGKKVSSLYDKQLVVLRYILSDITSGINKFMFRLSSAEFTRRQLTKNEIKKTLQDHIRPYAIFKIRSNREGVSSISSSSDNMYFHITSSVVQQSDLSKKTKKSAKKASLDDPSRLLHVSIAEVGCYNAVSKSDPTGRSKLNPYLLLNSDGTFHRREDLIETLDTIQADISI